MALIAVTSDLHLDEAGHLTSREQLEQLSRAIARQGADALVLAGDLGTSLATFEACVSIFAGAAPRVLVLAGNHDLWRDVGAGLSSERLFFEALPRACERAGATWFEGGSVAVGDVRLVGSMAWYDYSAVDESAKAPDEVLAQAKRLLNNDAHRIDWGRSDGSFAAELAGPMLARLDEAEGDASVRATVLVTHVPLLEAQMVRKPGNSTWGLSNAYFGNLTAGRAALSRRKLAAVVSGHTHIARSSDVARPSMPAVRALVVGSDYGEPAHLTLTV